MHACMHTRTHAHSRVCVGSHRCLDFRVASHRSLLCLSGPAATAAQLGVGINAALKGNLASKGPDLGHALSGGGPGPSGGVHGSRMHQHQQQRAPAGLAGAAAQQQQQQQPWVHVHAHARAHAAAPTPAASSEADRQREAARRRFVQEQLARQRAANAGPGAGR